MNCLFKTRIRQFATRVDFAKTFMPRKGFGGKLKLSQFLKFTHPDKFSEAGAQIQEVNANSVKELNQYLAAVQANTGVEQLDLHFYVRKPKKYQEQQYDTELQNREIKSKLLSLFQEKEVKSQDFQDIQEERPVFRRFNIKLLPLRANSSEALRRKHYENAIDSLNQNLAECLEKLKKQKQEYHEEEDLLESETYMESEMKAPWDAKLKPYKKKKEYREREKNELIAILSDLIDEQAKAAARDKAVNSIYKSVFNLPTNIQMREPGYEFRRVIHHTTALTDFAELIKTPIDPRLIYFHSQLSQEIVQKTVKYLKAEHLEEENQMQFLRGLQTVA